MLLHHFTSREVLPYIARDGISIGDVPVTPTQGLNAVWLTSDGCSDGHGLTDGRALTDEEKALKGIPKDTSAFFANKRAIRMTVLISREDRALAAWPSWGRRKLAPHWYEILNRTGLGKARTWYLYWGVIPPAWVREVRNLQSGEVLQDWTVLGG
jgi:hypothetical protein